MEDKVKNTKVQEIFNNMNYGESYEKIFEAIVSFLNCLCDLEIHLHSNFRSG